MVIYKTTNLINGKWYIGMDSKDNPNYLGSGVAISRAIKKYGKENFKKETLQTCKNVGQLEKAEIDWISKTNAVVNTNSYNMMGGGICGPKMFGKNNHNFGKYPHKMVNKTKKTIICLNDGLIFDKISDAARYYNTKPSKISRVCNLKRVSHRGLMFRYIGEENVVRKNKKCGVKKGNIPSNKKTVYCKELDMVFDSLTEAAFYCNKNNINTNRQSIRNVCNNKYKTAGGLNWSWDGR